jgi:aminoglycoside 3-N-acetyltransferase I
LQKRLRSIRSQPFFIGSRMKNKVQEFKIKRLHTKDVKLFGKLIELFQKIFEMKNTTPKGESYLKKILANPQFIAFTAFRENKVIGGLTGYELPMYYSKQSEIFIYDVGIKPEFQRKGVGKMLLSALKEYGKQNGVKEIFVAAHAEDRHALKFYKAINGKPEKVVHFNYKLHT